MARKAIVTRLGFLISIPLLAWAASIAVADPPPEGSLSSTPTPTPQAAPLAQDQPLPAPSNPTTTFAPDEVEAPVKPFGVDAGDSLTAAPASARINIAVTSNAESNPAIALCMYDEYLAVYERGGSIYGQRLTSQGALRGGAFLISDGVKPARNPDVACDWIYGLFVVVWETDASASPLNVDIQAQAIYGQHRTSGSQLRGSRLEAVANVTYDERNPALACNHDDNQCLVVYEIDRNNGAINGQRLNVGAAGLTSISNPPIEITTNSAVENTPDVAWSGSDNSFMVVWQYQYITTTTHYRIVFSEVWDTYRSSGSQVQSGTFWLINPGQFDHGQTSPSVAFNRRTGEHLIAFQYDYYGTGSDYDIIGLHEHTSPYMVGSPFWIASSGSHELEPSIAFSGGPENLPGMGANQFLVAYLYEPAGTQNVAAQAVKGAYAASGSQRDGSQVILDTVTGFGWGVFEPVVTGSVNNGRYLTAWRHDIGGIGNKNILGQMIAPYGVYLPFISRNYPPAPLYPNDPDFAADWRWPKVQAPEAWGFSTGGGSVIAVIDNGVDLTHPDLANVLWTNADEIAGNGIDDDGNGYVDDVHGYDFFDVDGNPSEPNSHGTGVALVAGAQTHNGYANASMGWNVRIMALRIGDATGWSPAALETALQYARLNGAKVINLSLSWNSSCPAYIQDDITAAFNAGVSVIASTDNAWLAPANCTGVIGVSASNANDTVIIPSVSSTYIDVAAPGSSTSHAAPMVTGLAALIRARYPAYTAHQIAEAILCNTDDIGQAALAGEGRVNAYKALLYGATGCGPSY